MCAILSLVFDRDLAAWSLRPAVRMLAVLYAVSEGFYLSGCQHDHSVGNPNTSPN